jgi:hypothetical protein
MDRLGYPHYVAQGGDVGANVMDAMGRQAPEGLLGSGIARLQCMGWKARDVLSGGSQDPRAPYPSGLVVTRITRLLGRIEREISRFQNCVAD